MKKLLLCIFLALICTIPACGGSPSPTFTGTYRMLRAYTPVTPPPKVVGNSTITFEPMLEFPPGTLDIYMVCIQDVARLNNVDAGT